MSLYPITAHLELLSASMLHNVRQRHDDALHGMRLTISLSSVAAAAAAAATAVARLTRLHVIHNVVMMA